MIDDRASNPRARERENVCVIMPLDAQERGVGREIENLSTLEGGEKTVLISSSTQNCKPPAHKTHRDGGGWGII